LQDIYGKEYEGINMVFYDGGRDHPPKPQDSYIENQHVHDLSAVDSALAVLLIVGIIVAVMLW
jgi:hypothetical protein